LQTISGELLRGVREAALRKRVWFKALDGVERGIINLTIGVVERVRSPTLAREVSLILEKLREALKSAFVRHVEDYGYGKLAGVIGVAVSFGNVAALGWGSESFARLLAVNNFNDPGGRSQSAEN